MPKSKLQYNFPKVGSNSEESGSAFVITLLVLFVLTVTGAGVLMNSQVQAMQSSYERQMVRSFYAADSGIQLAALFALWDIKKEPDFKVKSTLERPDGVEAVVQFEDQIDATPLVPILDLPCNYCSVNQGNKYKTINHAVTSTSMRVGRPIANAAADAIPQSTRTIDAMVLMQPRKARVQELIRSDKNKNDMRF